MSSVVSRRPVFDDFRGQDKFNLDNEVNYVVSGTSMSVNPINPIWQSPGALTRTTLFFGLDDILENLFVVNNKVDVITFLEQNYKILPILLQSRARLEMLFPDAEFILYLFYDPEGLESPRLQLDIETSLSVEDGVEKLDLFDETWWLDQSSKVGSKMSVNLEFK